MHTIAQAAARTGITAHTLRYYERIGLLDAIRRNTSGHRVFDDDDLGRIEFLTMLRDTGMPIAGMQRFIELTRAGDETIDDRIDVLESHRRIVTDTIEQLQQHNTVLDKKLEIYRNLKSQRQRSR